MQAVTLMTVHSGCVKEQQQWNYMTDPHIKT